MSYSDRLHELASTIASRTSPLGADFNSGCWGAEAARIAADHGEDPCTYYGFSPTTYRNAIKRNAEIPPTRRNKEMRRITLELAAN
jgi:endonuclease/exonuclease/phosphatase (EEP) superfamily protein YafD